MNHSHCASVCTVILAAQLNACSLEEPPITPPLKLLAQDVRFSIADQPVRLPLVAISKTGHVCSEKDKIPCSIPIEKIYTQEPITVNVLQISLEDYSSFRDSRAESYIGVPELCPMLSQEWARRICQSNGLGKHIDFLGLRRFYLVKEDYMGSFNTVWLDNGNLGEMGQKMSLDGKNPSSYCKPDKQGNPPSLCAAAMRIANNLLAVWVVTRAGAEKLRIARDGQTIRSFMQFGLGETENFEALNAALQ
jgi:hypothetical protein